ncbi:MAG: CehA/McbA family metallohydrolase [Maioricimonas sp. JB049]
MRIAAPFVVLLLATVAIRYGLVAEESTSAPVELVRLSEENWDQYVPEGKEVDAIYGDLVLRNDRIVAVIAQPLASRHANMTVRTIAGALIDFTQRETQSDQLSAFYPGQRQYSFRSWNVTDANGTEHAVGDTLRVAGDEAAITVSAAATDDKPAVDVTYRLAAGSDVLEVTSTFTNTGSEPLTVSLVDDLRADGGKEDMVKSPNGTADMYWFDDRFWQQAFGIMAEGRQIQSNSNSRTSTLKYVDRDGESSVELPGGERVRFTRYIAPGRNLLDVRAVFTERRGTATTPVTLNVRDGIGRAVPQARLELTDADGQSATAVTDERGQIMLPMSRGRYTLSVLSQGITVAEDRSLVVHGAVQQAESIILADYTPGTVTAKITDEQGQPIPCKVEFIPADGTPRPDFGPETAEHAVRNLRYAPRGTFSQDLYPGDYEVIISHGPEFDAIFTGLTVKPGETAELTGQLVRSVDTTGWVSSDFHSHSTPSGDNTASQLGRVLNLVCEHIEFAPCTEHNRIDSYDEHIRSQRIGSFIATCTGMELTGNPLPLNHQNAFPLHHHPHTQDGGGPVTDGDPSTQIERLALWDDRSEKLIQQNHPDLGWLVYDKDGDGQPDEGFTRSIGFIDVVEIHPVEAALQLGPQLAGSQRNHRIFNWLQMQNQGLRMPGVVNTDAHYNYHGSGWLRNWIKSNTDDPARIDTMDIVRASEAGNVIMSNGPFLEVRASEAGSDETVTAGDDLSAPSGNVNLHVRVQCPNWLDINLVSVLVNGRPAEGLQFRRASHSEKFGDGVVKFDQSLTVPLEEDAHIVVITGGEGLQLGPVVGPARSQTPPAALSNPIYVDVDGGGFTPNKDTLGHPLPVKGGR